MAEASPYLDNTGVSEQINRCIAARILKKAAESHLLTASHLIHDGQEGLVLLLGESQYRALHETVEPDDDKHTALDPPWRRSHRRQPTSASHAATVSAITLVEQSAAHESPPADTVRCNVARLGEILSLEPIEIHLLELCVRSMADPLVSTVLEVFERQRISVVRFRQFLARLFNCSLDRVYRLLSPAGRLGRSGLLEVSSSRIGMHGTRTMSFDDITLIDGLADQMTLAEPAFDEMFGPFFRRLALPRLTVSDFSHLTQTAGLLCDLFQGAIRRGTAAPQVLLHGPPGTGKSELARAIVHRIAARGYDVATEGTDGEVYDAGERMRNAALAQNALRGVECALLVFDEVEEVLNPAFGGNDSPARRKGWINHFLEHVGVPGIWIGNGLAGIDAAHLRRFTMVIEIGTPPRSVRRRIAEHYLTPFGVPARYIERIADFDSITPAELERTADTLSLVQPRHDVTSTTTTILTAGTSTIRRSDIEDASSFDVPAFDPSFINSELDLETLAVQLKARDEGRLCFSGAPGTGNTAAAHYIAEVADRELITVSASSWLAPLLGVSERLMRNSFDTAAERDAVLFVDEADTFLRDRALASQSWQTSQVNELLKCIETSQGIVVFATNAFDALDPAVLRRFDIKTTFRPLNAQQRVELFERTLEHNNLAPDDISLSQRECIAGLSGLVNGDFATACRRLTLLDTAMGADTLCDALVAEVAYRQSHGRALAIGFMA